MGTAVSDPAFSMFDGMDAHMRRDFLDANPELAQMLRAFAQLEAGTDVDATSLALGERLDALGIRGEDRNELLANLTVEGETVFPTANPDIPLKRRMRLLDLMWVGALVHEYYDQLFPKEEPS